MRPLIMESQDHKDVPNRYLFITQNAKLFDVLVK